MNRKPEGYERARNGLEKSFRDMDFIEKRKKNKNIKVNGPKAIFLEEYKKMDIYLLKN